jgi:choline dehydrogenase-like flavoprotein
MAKWSAENRWSQHIGMGCRPLETLDLEARSWVPHSGWPFDLSHLLPFYEHAHDLCGIGPVEYDVNPSHQPEDRQPLAPNSDRLETTLVRFAEPSRLLSHLSRLVEAGNVTLLTGAQAVEVETKPSAGQVSRVRLRAQGRELWASAKLYVLACGGIENARLLLLSDRTFPAGLGNGNDLVGRYFMEHVVLNRGVIVPRTGESYGRLGLYQRHDSGGARVLGSLRLTESVRRREELLTVILSPYVGRRAFASEGVRSLATLAGSLRKRERPRRLVKTARDIVGDPLAVIQATYLVAAGADLRKAGYFGILPHLEQAPRPDNRVTLSDKRDELGLRLPHLSWRLGDEEERSLRRTVEIVAEELEAANEGRLAFELSSDEFCRLAHVSHHHIGTTRMHADPTHGVVDADCRVHSIANLFIAGSSVFPTSGGVTVTLTIMALAARLAEHLRARLAEGIAVAQAGQPSTSP